MRQKTTTTTARSDIARRLEEIAAALERVERDLEEGSLGAAKAELCYAQVLLRGVPRG